MNYNRLLSLCFALCCLGSYSSFARKVAMTPDLDIKMQGWNKVLCMKNGNTILMHMEPGKRIMVKVFDSSHEEIATAEDYAKDLDESMMQFVEFKGIYDINGEAVLFVDQEKMGRHRLVMLRYDAFSGKLIEDKVVKESESADRRIRFRVMKNKSEKGYCILYCMDKRHIKENDLWIEYFDENNHEEKEVQLTLDRNKFDYIQVLGAEVEPQGVLVTIGADSAAMYNLHTDHAQHSQAGALDAKGTIYDHYVEYFYIPKGDTSAYRKEVNVSTNIFPYFALYAYNNFAGAANSLLYSYKPVLYKYGLLVRLGCFDAELFCKINGDMSITSNFVRHTSSDAYIEGTADTVIVPNFVPMRFFTNSNGLSTIVAQSTTYYGEPETRVRYDFESFLGDIEITQLDDNGNLLFRKHLPLSQYFKSNRMYYPIRFLPASEDGQNIFDVLPDDTYNRQFPSINAYTKDRNFYVVFNDYDKNFNDTVNRAGDTVYNFSATNACYYRMDRKKEFTRHYLFDEPAKDEYMASFIEGAAFDEQRGVYATLVQYTKGNSKSLRMAWARLD